MAGNWEGEAGCAPGRQYADLGAGGAYHRASKEAQGQTPAGATQARGITLMLASVLAHRWLGSMTRSCARPLGPKPPVAIPLPLQVRAMLGPSRLLGVSCKSLAHVLAAAAGGADYAGSGAGARSWGTAGQV